MTTILALEAASNRCSVALLHGGEVFERAHDVPREHARVLLPYLDELLRDAGLRLQDIDALAVGRGPGSFTGVRAAIATVQGLALGSGLPVVAESTLRVLAAGACRAHAARRCLALLDARMNEVYAAAYEDGSEVWAERLLAPDRLAVPAAWQDGGDWIVAGSGLQYGEEIPPSIRGHAVTDGAALHPSAGDLARLAAISFAAGVALTDPAALQPVYLRDQVVHQRS